MALDLMEMRSAYAHIELYEILQGAVLEAEKFMTRTKDLQNLTHQLGEALLKIETHMKQLEATPVRHYGSKIEQIQNAYTNAGPVVEEATCCTKGFCFFYLKLKFLGEPLSTYILYPTPREG